MYLNGQCPGMDSQDIEDSMTVTMALDRVQPGRCEAQADPGLSNSSIDLSELLQICPPPDARRLFPELLCTLLISQLPHTAVQCLQLRLNTPALGRMRNWEFLAAQLGCSMDEIANWRRRDNPVEELLSQFGPIPANRLVDALADMRRVDVLIVLAPLLATERARDKTAENRDSGAGLSLHSTGRTSRSGKGEGLQSAGELFLYRPEICDVPTTRVLAGIDKILSSPDPFIIVLHHELASNKLQRSYIRMLLHNLRANAPPPLRLLDVDDCVDERSLNTSLQRLYDRADQILLVASEDYAHSVVMSNDSTASCSAGDNWRCRLKQYLHQAMNAEYMRNGMKNERFRVVLTEGTERRWVPNGWASNTIVYEFPANFQQLCERVFRQ